MAGWGADRQADDREINDLRADLDRHERREAAIREVLDEARGNDHELHTRALERIRSLVGYGGGQLPSREGADA
jgi:hypothetical protein